MKLVVCVVHSRDKGRVTDELVKAGYKSTIVSSTGGFLREGNTTFLIGVENEQVGTLKELVAANCSSREQIVNVMPFEPGTSGVFLASPVNVPVGGAVMFVLDVDQFYRF